MENEREKERENNLLEQKIRVKIKEKGGRFILISKILLDIYF